MKLSVLSGVTALAFKHRERKQSAAKTSARKLLEGLVPYNKYHSKLIEVFFFFSAYFVQLMLCSLQESVWSCLGTRGFSWNFS